MNLLFGLIPLASDPNVQGAPFTHDRTLVAVSMLFALVGSFVFLELAARSRAHRGRRSLRWAAAAGAVLGFGIYQTHLTGLLALQTPLVHGVDRIPTVVSGVIAIAGVAVGFPLVSARTPFSVLVLVGIGVAFPLIVMHYLGLQGLHLEGSFSYLPVPAAMTAIGDVVGIILAFHIAHRLEHSWMRAIVAFPMAAIIAGFHYFDMAGSILTPSPTFGHVAPNNNLALGFAVADIIAAVAAGLWLAFRDRKRVAIKEERAASGSDVVVIPHPSRRSITSAHETVVQVPDRNARNR